MTNQQIPLQVYEAICAHLSQSVFGWAFLLGGTMKVGIIMGSKSDLDTMKKASAILDEFNIPYEMVIASAHRTPEAVKNFVTRLEDEGAIAFIAGAGAAAHLPGVVASFTTVPVIGIPLNATALKGIDSLLAIVQNAIWYASSNNGCRWCKKCCIICSTNRCYFQ